MIGLTPRENAIADQMFADANRWVTDLVKNYTSEHDENGTDEARVYVMGLLTDDDGVFFDNTLLAPALLIAVEQLSRRAT